MAVIIKNFACWQLNCAQLPLSSEWDPFVSGGRGYVQAVISEMQGVRTA